MKISNKYIRLTLLLILLTAFFSVTSYAQVVYKGFNSATAKGTALGKEVNDNSNSGTVVNKNNDNPTQIVFPMIGLAKTAGTPIIQADGTYNVTYTLRVQNYSTIALNNVQITDDLNIVFPDNATNAKYTILPGAVSIVTPDATNGTGVIAVNSAFNGDTDKNLLVAASSSLTSNATGSAYFATILFTINVNPKGISEAYNKAYNNTATTTATTIVSPDAPIVVTVTDVSNNSTTPHNGDNTKTPLYYNTPTPVTLVGSDIQVIKSSSSLTPNVNTDITFTIKVKNNGPGIAAPVVLNDLLPAGFTFVSKTVSQGTYNEATGIWSVGTMQVGAVNEKTLTVTATVLPNKTIAQYTNNAVTDHPGDPVPENNTSEVIITPKKLADLKITNDDGKTEYTPGTSNTYTIVVTNDGPSDVTGATVANTLPTGFTGTWTAVYAGGATGTANGSGSISELVNMPSGATITYTYVVNVPSSYTVDPYANTATVTAPAGVTDPTPANNTATDNDTKVSKADLKITKTDNKLKYTPGTTNTYSIVVTNVGPSDVIGATVEDLLPANSTGSITKVYTGGASTTTTTSTTTQLKEIVNLPKDATITYTLIVSIPSNQTGNYINTATVTLPAGVTDVDLTNNTASDDDEQESRADLKITKTDNKTDYVPGTTNTYTIVVTNDGPSDVIGAIVEDVLPIKSTGTVTIAYSGGSSTTSSTSTPAQLKEVVNMPNGSKITYTYVVSAPSDQLGNYVNTATISAPAGVIDADLTNNSATDTDIQTSKVDLRITKTDNKNTYTPGTSNTYTIVVNNDGPSDVLQASIVDELPAGFNGTLSAVYTGGASGTITNVGTYSTGINELVNMPINATITYTFIVNVPSSFTGNLTNKAKITPPTGITDTDLSNNEATDIDNQDSYADLEIIKVASSTRPSFKTNVEFTLTAINKGPSDATGVNVTDLLKAGFTFVSATPSQGTFDNAIGIWTIGNLLTSQTVTLKIVAVVNLAGPYDNTAVITGNEKDPVLPNNTSTIVLIPQDTPNANDDQVNACDASILLIDILANDVKSNFDIDPTTVVIVKQPNSGVIKVDPTTGKVTYTPNAGFTGSDEFTYTVNDKNGGKSNVATVKININQSIVAVNDSVTTDPNSAVIIDILANDTKGSSAIIPGSVVITQQPTNGTLNVDPVTGKVIYTPNNGYVGTDSFKYTVKDAAGCTSNVATVTIKMNDLPKIGIAKAVMSAVKLPNGSYNITYHFVIGNYGTGVLNNLSIKDDLNNTFKGDIFSVKSITTLGTLRVNNQFNGTSVTEMLATGNTLAIGETQRLEIVVNIIPGRDKVTYYNSAFAEGSSVTSLKTTDQSTDGLKPDISGDVSPKTPTPVDLTRPLEFIPEGFSPNRDGTNDTFVISNTGNKRINLEIYNRWGNIVYKNTDYKNDWAGQSNQGIRVGNDLPEGTYFYVIVLDGKDKYVGAITLKR